MIPYSSVAFCGVGGSGMSAIAQVLAANKIKVIGTDRNFDQGNCLDMKSKLESQSIKIFKQDGSFANDKPNVLVVSTAIEKTIPDVKAALENNIPVIKRAELLSIMFNQQKGIAIGGTSGKSTVTGMTGYLLYALGQNPAIINGGIMENFKNETSIGNAYPGTSEYMVIEADESDGTIELYNPFAAILTNISLDHKPLEELLPLFLDFCNRTKGPLIINLDCLETKTLLEKIKNPNLKSFSLKSKSANYFSDNIKLYLDHSEFTVNGVNFILNVPGMHNIANALASIALCHSLGFDLKKIAIALESFKGIGRRLQKIGSIGELSVYDDFAHNPEKIEATLQTFQEHLKPNQRLLVMFQPHGFAPTRMLKNGFIKAFSDGLKNNDIVLLPEIFYAGGTAVKDISSNDLAQGIKNNGKQALFFQNRNEIKEYLINNFQKTDTIIIMGARDDTLTSFAKEILTNIKSKM